MGAERRVDYDGRLAQAYDAGRHLLAEAEAAWAASVRGHVRRGDLVLDVGAGTGRFAHLFARDFGATVLAVEPARGMRAKAAAERPEGAVAWMAGRAEALPVRSGVVDVVWLCCVIHYLDLTAAGVELARVLRPGGKVLVRSVFPDRFDDLVWLRWFPSARAIDEQRMPAVEELRVAWAPVGLQLTDRVSSLHLAATDLADLADRLAHRSISTLALISDDEFASGLARLRTDAATTSPEPVNSPVDVLVFSCA